MSTVTPQWKLRRLAPRAVRIANRRAQQSPALAAFLATLAPKAEAYVAAYDHAAKFQANWKKEMAEGRSAVARLLKGIQSWAPLLKRDIPGFDGSTYGDNPEVPDDVIEDGERMMSVVEEFRDSLGAPLAYHKAALDSLGPLLQGAVKEWSEAEAADAEYQKDFAAVRAMADSLQRDLAAFRRTLMATVGRKDKDFQKLRVEHAGEPDEDDDPNVPVPPKPVVAAAPGANARAVP
jgi:hypothetical protein